MNMIIGINAMYKIPKFGKRVNSAKRGKIERRFHLARLIKANSGEWNAPRIAIEMDTGVTTVKTDIKTIANIFKRPDGKYIWIETEH